MSFPPPNSGQYPQYIPPPQYQPGHVAPPQFPYNHVAAPSPSPYGYGKPAGYPQGMMQQQQQQQVWNQYGHHFTQPMSPQAQHHQQQQQQQQPTLQPAALIHPQHLAQPQHPAFSQAQQISMSQMQQPSISQPRQSPIVQPHQSPLHQTQQPSPRMQMQQQSPRVQIQPQQSPRPQLQQLQQSPRPQFQQQSPQPRVQQQSPRPQYQQQPSPRPQFQQQSPLVQMQQHAPLVPSQQQSPRLQVLQPSPRPQLKPQQSPQLQMQQHQQLQHQQSQPASQPQMQQHQNQQHQQQPQHQQSQNQQPQHQKPQPAPQPQMQQQPQYQQPQYQQQPSPVSKPQAIPHQPRPPPMPPAPPPSLPPELPQHQFINPAELFVQPPLPTAPRSRYGSLSQYIDPSELSTSLELPPMPSIASSTPPPAESKAPQPSQIPDPKVKPGSPQPKKDDIPMQLDAKQSDTQIKPPPAPKPVVKSESAKSKPAPKKEPKKDAKKEPKKEVKQAAATPKKEPKQPAATPKVAPPKATPPNLAPSKVALSQTAPPKVTPPDAAPAPTKVATPIQPQPTSSPTQHAVPQVMIPAPSQDFRSSSPKPIQKKPQPKKQLPSQQTTDRITKPTKPPVDYQVLLLSLADEYLNAAHRHGTKTALVTSQADVEEYYKLVSTGLGCLEAVLKNWRLQPRKEALVRLRYARTLFEETDNDLEAETALSKGIDLCERNRMLDLKYSMQHLLARMLHKTNPKASLKAVDGMIQDVEAYRHAAWEYTFRFLRVTLSLSSSSHQDSVQALQHLNKISAMASRNGDKAVAAMAAVIEALAHLQQGTGSDAIEQAQRAVAVARSHQLNDELRHIPQLVTLTQMVDICCSLLEYDVPQASQKLKVLQTLADETLNDPNWRADGSFSIPLNGKSAGPSSIDTGDILQVQNGMVLLSFNWLPQHDLYALSYFLSSITLSAKNSYDGRKAEQFLDEGLRMVQGGFTTPQEISESMVNATRRVEWRRSLCCNFLLQRVFLACARTDWELATHSLKELRQFTQECGPSLPRSIECLMEYAAGTIAQATGDLARALNIFQSPLLLLSPSASKIARNDPCRDTCILAALNTILIIRDPSHPGHSHLPTIQATLEPFCQNGPNKYIQAAYYLVCATVQTESTIQTKQFLQHALQSATTISNSQITCMTLTFMSWKYFRGVVGEQAEKSVRAGRAMAKRANDRLWASVTDEMLAETLERHGKGDEALSVREEGQRLITGLPPSLKRPA
ncbi:uncharacterized protein N7473_013357 [Penicillium subrubescens]|uniref:MAU2 chromatid cohesion factor-like protein n=1 Tax=Penicillium subrubescens TaxID=1316194 RepID=A0A1Q5TE04_9EURO|nr:uncharacterized protein N7473_013357 [Penicillium subrubescens]KAJ5873484.1 hypothetical protein N7473_013357 [Penicillium subrubescens]OKO98454.1 hypothetical protein PENSUB_9130 [Penicillium subrubescens]